MGVIFWRVYYTVFLLCLLQTLLSDRVRHSSGERDRLAPLKTLCVDNTRTNSWWTYIICFHGDVLQVHYDGRSKQLKEKIHLGSYDPQASTASRHVYSNSTLSCGKEMLPRQVEVVLECCTQLEAMRQSRHSHHSSAERVAMHAHATLKSTTATAATRAAYIRSVVEPRPCVYEIVVCSDLICRATDTDTDSDADAEGTVEGDADADVTPTHAQFRVPVDITLDKNYRPVHSAWASSASAEIRAQERKTLSKFVPVKKAAVKSKESEEGWGRRDRARLDVPSMEEQGGLRERARSMFYHGYDSYMHNAYPKSELRPISCSGGSFELIKIPLVTLIDTMDTLVILSDHSEFRRVVNIVSQDLLFNIDVNVSVFETTIRVLGGLLSAHLMAIDPALGIYTYENPYDGRLLALSIDLGNRLLPAFETKTFIPFGTVNLLHGVPAKETKIASTAGAGSLLVEFQILSYLSGDPRYGTAAYAATAALYDRRSPIGLLGKHINTETGHWSESMSGVGSNADSFYEYLLKSYLLFRDNDLYLMFSSTYRAIKRFVIVNDWFSEVDMFSGKQHRKRVENLDAFWPGVETSLGYTSTSAKQLNAFYSVWQDLGFLPEEFHQQQWQAGKGALNGQYPLRPELIESTYHQYRSTGDRSWLAAGRTFLDSIEHFTRTDCGYASVATVKTMALEDSMPSYFLSETCKYLFLLFDEENFVNQRPYIFSTEAHPFDAVQLHFQDRRNSTSPSGAGGGGARGVAGRRKRKGTKSERSTAQLNDIRTKHLSFIDLINEKIGQEQVGEKDSGGGDGGGGDGEVLPTKCRKPSWWDESTSYDGEFLQEVNSNMRKEVFRSQKRRGKTTHVRSRVARGGGAGGGGTEGGGTGGGGKGGAGGTGAGGGGATHHRGRLGVRRRFPGRVAVYQISVLLDQLNLISYYNDFKTCSGDGVVGYGSSGRGGGGGVGADVGGCIPYVSKLAVVERPSPFLATPDTCPAVDEPPQNDTGKGTGIAGAKGAGCGGAGAVGAGGAGAEDGGGAGGAGDEFQFAPGELKSVEVNMGALGEFVMKVYSDGFLIYNRKDRIKLQISNVGRPVVIARETVEGVVGVTIAHKGAMGRCSVRIEDTGADETDDAARTTWDRPCSVANFGPTGSSLSQGSASVSVYGALSRPQPQNKQLCLDQQPKPKSLPERWWWAWGQPKGGGDGKGGDDKSEKAKAGKAGKGGLSGDTGGGLVVLAYRGGCLFEEKAALARDLYHPDAVIIRNTEDDVFVMAGRKDLYPEEGDGLEINGAEEAGGAGDGDGAEGAGGAEGAVAELPLTVMLSHADGDDLLLRMGMGAADQGQGQIRGQRLAVDYSLQHVLFSSALMGDSTVKLYAQPDVIIALGSGSSGWGAVVKATQGEDWQLFLMSKDDILDMLSQAPLQVLSQGGQSKSLSRTVLSAVHLYAHTIERKCPDIVHRIDGATVYIKN